MNSRSSPSPESSRLLSYCYAICGFFFMALFGFLTKIASEKISFVWVSFLTYLFCCIWLLPFVKRMNSMPLKGNLLYLNLARSFFGLGASFFYMMALNHISLANATLLYSTAPIFIPLICMVLWKHSIPLSTWLAIGIGFLGIALIIRPDLSVLTDKGNLYGLSSGLSLGFAFISLKRLVLAQGILFTIFIFSLIAAFMQIPILVYANHHPSIMTCGLILFIALAYIGAQFFISSAYLAAGTPEVGVFQYLTIVYALIIQWFAWGILPSTQEAIGSLLVAAAGFSVILTDSMQKTS